MVRPLLAFLRIKSMRRLVFYLASSIEEQRHTNYVEDHFTSMAT